MVTCFFIDTAHNIVQYLETLWTVLRPGGLWVNIGPLLYHYADSEEDSIELPWDMVKVVAAKVGFVMLVQMGNNRKRKMWIR